MLLMKETDLIESLIQASEFQELQDLGEDLHNNQREFDLLSVYSDLIDEKVWSKLFAYVLDSTQNHGLSQQVFRKMISGLSTSNNSFQALPTENETRTICLTEWTTDKGRRIDILIKLIDKKGGIKAVVGIENKVESGEQRDQIKDYQQSLIRAFPRMPRILLYLTPDGRWAKTGEDNAECSCEPISYKFISEVCGSVKSTHSKVFLSVLITHIDKLTNSNNMDDTAKELVSKLYMNPNYRHAIKLIDKHAPKVKHVFESVKKSIETADDLPFPSKEITFGYYPKKSSNPYELKLYVHELSALVNTQKYSPAYILRCENANPDIGDTYTLRLALYSNILLNKDAPTRQAIIKKVVEKFSFRNQLGTDKNWSRWICVWTGDSYTLADNGKQDAEGLKSLLIEGVKATYEDYKKGLKKLAKVQW